MKFLKTISVDNFKEILASIPQIHLEEEIIPIEKSYNRTLSKDIMSPINVPHFRKSKMDGYAVISKDTFNAEENNLISLKLIEIIDAGTKPQKELKPGQCSYTATGAAIPEGADAIIMVEYTEKEGDQVLISKAIAPGTDLMGIGADIKKGEIILKAGMLISLPIMGILSSCGIKKIYVFRKPVASLMSTGNEIVTQDTEELDIGKIYDINSIVLKRAIENTGVEINYLGIVKDNFDDLKAKLDQALTSSDVVILSGGTSKGEGDLGPKVLSSIENIEIQVHGVKIKPGKPIIFAKFGKKIIFILPGYPTSALSCFYVFIDDFLRRMTNFPLRSKNSVEYELGERIYSSVGRHEFKPVKLKEEGGVKKIYPILTGSEAITTLFYADGYIEIGELESIVEKGDKKAFYPF